MTHLEGVMQWLEAGDAADYRDGVLLLQDHTGNRSLINLLLRKESAANREKLRYELIKVGCEGRMEDVSEVLNHFAQAVQLVVPSAFVTAAVPLAEQPAPDLVPEAVRSQVDEITQLMGKLYNQRCQLSNSLADIDAATDGPRVVGEILSLQNQYNALAEKRRRLVAGEPVAEVPAAEQPASTINRAELMQARQNLRSNISKTKAKLATAKSEAKKSELEQKIGVLNTELTNLDMQLALPQA